MPYRRTPATQARLDERRVRVVDAAVELLAEHGYAGCSMAAVAARAGIATGSVYRHFTGKSELAVEVFRTVVSREVDAVAEAAARPSHRDAADRVVAVIETFAHRALKSPRLAYALLAEPVDPAVDAERLVFRRAFRDVFAERIAEGARRGQLPPQDASLTASALVGAGAEALVGPLSEGSAGPDTVPALVTFTLRALGVPDADHT
ncbi:TetR/AcrR family transcriptional regulator [Streptomyces sp. NBC_01216]|uniref:TetR/AcrR family transcriptional regulator n=1 Tax=unclassified Streptomyces TaxID=2593676 RepID=UPI002E0DDDB3|nr:TetR/AcrR family transcriptional regulator [Streptomyces sp. NBC_01216]